MARDLDEHGAAFLKHGETSQSLTISDIFTLKDGSVTPVLKVTYNKFFMMFLFHGTVLVAADDNFLYAACKSSGAS
jgi:hypothetical protein